MDDTFLFFIVLAVGYFIGRGVSIERGLRHAREDYEKRVHAIKIVLMDKYKNKDEGAVNDV